LPPLHETTFGYLKPTDKQLAAMAEARAAAKAYADELDRLLPVGEDKDYALRKLREVAMWANVSISRHEDGSPRAEEIEF
jgi:deoxyribose-phosphate aldolase